MRDDEIRTAPKSSFVPEQDLKLVKAFGKFVEEAGELLEVTSKILTEPSVFEEDKCKLEDEIADCRALTTIIIGMTLQDDYLVTLEPISTPFPDITLLFRALQFINLQLSQCLTIVGRCQIQGVDGEDPKTHKSNSLLLQCRMSALGRMLNDITVTHAAFLDAPRIEQRMQAKIDLKLPWIMETSA